MRYVGGGIGWEWRGGARRGLGGVPGLGGVGLGEGVGKVGVPGLGGRGLGGVPGLGGVGLGEGVGQVCRYRGE